MFGAATLLLVLVLLAIAVIAHQLPLFILAVALLLAIGMSRLWDKYCLVNLEYTRKLSSRSVEFGGTVDLEVELVNRKILPLAWIEVEEEIPRIMPPVQGLVYPSNLPHRLLLGSNYALRPYERVRKKYRFECSQRGEHVIGPGRLRTGDLFGLLTRQAPISKIEKVVVYPRIVPVSSLGLPAHQPLGDLRAQSWIFEDPTRVAGAREYRPGDSLRRIHWAASARTQQLQSRVYESTTSHKLAIFLNLETVEGFTLGLDYRPDVLELVITTAASVANWGMEQGYQVGLYANGWYSQAGLSYVAIHPARDPAQLTHILEALARVQPYPMKRYEEVLAWEEPHLTYGTTVIAVSGLMRDSIARSLRSSRSHGHPAVLLYCGRSEMTGAPAGVTVRRIGPPDAWNTMVELAPAAPQAVGR